MSIGHGSKVYSMAIITKGLSLYMGQGSTVLYWSRVPRSPVNIGPGSRFSTEYWTILFPGDRSRESGG